jgi:4'-phosphopantetheinyl transferase
LPGEERERAERIAAPESRRRWTASRWALRSVLGRYLGEDPAAIELRTGGHGKPELALAPERFDFNLSHSGDLALVAVAAGRQVGVDVERAERDRDFLALAERGLGPEGATAVRAADPALRPAVFYAAWVRREALLKCFGGGLGNPAPRAPAAVADLDVGEGYAAALAVAGGAAPVVVQMTISTADRQPRR